MAYQVKEFELCHAPDNINNWLHDNPENEVISSYSAGHLVGIVYKTPENTENRAETLDWIFSTPPFSNEYDWDKIEKALGFKLFYWQKAYIQIGEFRNFGKTTANVLRDLLYITPGIGPIEICKSVTNSSKIRMYREFYEKLTEAGIPCRDLLVKKGRTQNGHWYP